MGLFGKILDKLSFGKTAHAAELPDTASASTAAPGQAASTAPTADAPQSATPSPAATTAAAAGIQVVDVVAQLEAKAAASPQKLNWKTSIVDLLRLLELDHSLAARKELAQELGCPPEKIGGDYSQMNIWLHKTVLQKLADNGGNIPKELLD